MDKKKFTKIATMLILAAAGGCIGFLAAKIGMDSAKTTPLHEVIAVTVFFVPAFFIVIGIHEAGHAFAGKLVHFDFRMYVVGPFMWDKEASGWKFKWNKNVNVSGGMVISLPKTTENLARRFSMYALGGPAFSLLFSAIAFIIKYGITLANTGNNAAIHSIGSLFGLLSFFSLLIFIFTAVPLHGGGFYTDGARTIRFLRGGETSRFELLLMKIILSSSGGIRPRELDTKELDEALALAKKLDAPMGVYLYGYYYQIALDLEDFAEAEKYLKKYMDQMEDIPKGIRNAVWLDGAFFYAYAKKDKQQAEHYWSQFRPSAILPKSQVFATEAALHVLRNEKELAVQKIEAALKELPNMLDRGIGIALKDKLMQMRNSL